MKMVMVRKEIGNLQAYFVKCAQLNKEFELFNIADGHIPYSSQICPVPVHLVKSLLSAVLLENKCSYRKINEIHCYVRI